MVSWWILALFLIVAALYASVGHGGASGYLALMALLSLPPDVIRPTALGLNIAVSMVAFLFYRQAGHFKWSLFWPFAITSVPCAWLGAQVHLDDRIFRLILGVFLLIAVWRILMPVRSSKELIKKNQLALSLVIGAVLGSLSGMIGIGGGILLSPLLLLLHWADVRTTAAISALFILVNSISGLAGVLFNGASFSDGFPWLAGVVVIGALLGGWVGSMRSTSLQLRRLLAVVLLLASVKLLLAP